MATDSWEASADKAQMRCWWDRDSLASKQRIGPIGPGSALLMGQGSGLSCFLSSPRGAPTAEGFCLEQLLSIRPCAGKNDRSLSFTLPLPQVLSHRPEQTSILGTGTEQGPGTASGKSETSDLNWEWAFPLPQG